MFRNKILLDWEEPRFAEKYAIKQLTSKDYSTAYGKYIWKWAAGTFVVFSIVRWLSPREVNSIIDLEIIGVVLLVVVPASLVWLLSVYASSYATKIQMREKSIKIKLISGDADIAYKKIQSCSIGKTEFEKQEFGVLHIKYWDGNESFIEIAPHIKSEAVIEILESKNIQIKPFFYKLN